MKYNPSRWNSNPYEKGNIGLSTVYTDDRINLTSVPGYVARKRNFYTSHAYAMWENLSECDIPPTKITNKYGAVTGYSYGQAYVIYISQHVPMFIYDKQIKQWFEGESENETKELRRTREACRPSENITVLDAGTMDLVRRYGFNAVARLRMQGSPVTRSGILKARFDAVLRFANWTDRSKW